MYVKKVPFVTLILTVVSFFALGATHLEGLRWDYDEGVHSMEARLLLDGLSLYREVYSSDMPLFIRSLSFGFRLLGSSIQTARLVTLVYASIGLLSIGLLGYLLGDRWAGTLTCLVLATSSTFFHAARVCWDDIPSLALATSAILLAGIHDRRGGCHWLLLSGVSYGLALSLKLLIVPVAPVLLLLCLRRDLRWPSDVRSALKSGATFSLGCGLTMALLLAPFWSRAAFQQLILFPSQAARSFAETRSGNWLQVMIFLVHTNTGITITAVFGLWAGFSQRRVVVWPAVAWLLCSGLALLVHVPLWSHLLVSILFPLVVLSGIGLDEARKLLFHSPVRSLRWWSSIIVLIMFLLALPRSVMINLTLLEAPSPASALASIEWLRRSTPQQAVILTDDALIPFVAGRRTPPGLTDTSFKRISSGMLTAEHVIAIADATRPTAAVLWREGRFMELPEVVQWIEDHYQSQIEYEDGTRLFFEPIWEPSATTNQSQ